jgi:hypothetical protein
VSGIYHGAYTKTKRKIKSKGKGGAAHDRGGQRSEADLLPGLLSEKPGANLAAE